MKLDPNTTVVALLMGVPSCANVFRSLGITPGDHGNKTLQQVCGEAGITFEDFLRRVDEIDWEQESTDHPEP